MEDVGTPSKPSLFLVPPRKVGSKVLRACVTTEDPSAAETYAEILKTPGEVGFLDGDLETKLLPVPGNEQQKRQKHQGI